MATKPKVGSISTCDADSPWAAEKSKQLGKGQSLDEGALLGYAQSGIAP